MTSELRLLASVPNSSADSSNSTSRPSRASRLATASPMTPAPTTTQSTLSMPASLPRYPRTTALPSGNTLAGDVLRVMNRAIEPVEYPLAPEQLQGDVDRRRDRSPGYGDANWLRHLAELQLELFRGRLDDIVQCTRLPALREEQAIAHRLERRQRGGRQMFAGGLVVIAV